MDIHQRSRFTRNRQSTKTEAAQQSFWRSKTSLVSLMCGLLLVAAGCDKREDNAYVAPPPPKVKVGLPVTQDVTLFIEETGSTEPTEDAEVRARVQGFVQQILFQPGQQISMDGGEDGKGDILYNIEPDFYLATEAAAEATLAAARASLEVARAALDTAKADQTNADRTFGREKRLLESGAGSQSVYDEAVAALESANAKVGAEKAGIEQASAQIQQAEADLERAKLDVRYTKVRAPISGVVTKTTVKLGNLVKEGDSLATVVNSSKMFVNFSISDSMLLRLMRARSPGEVKKMTPEMLANIPVYIRRDKEENWIMGRLEYAAPTGVKIDTGTLPLRALFDNEGADLVSGMFVLIRVPLTRQRDVILIPERAILRSQLGTAVLALNKEDVVQRKQVEISHLIDGWAIVSEGLSKDERIVTDGLQKARPGQPVTPETIVLSTDSAPMLNVDLRVRYDEDQKGNGDADKGQQADAVISPPTPSTPDRTDEQSDAKRAEAEKS